MDKFVEQVIETVGAMAEVSQSRGDRYDQERCEEILRFVGLFKSGNCDELTLEAVVEAQAKTNIALTSNDEIRQISKQLADLAKSHAAGREFYGPPAEPRTTDDSSLVSISSRYITPICGVNVVISDGSGKLLLVQRADRGQWALPGGYADVGLSPAEVAIKEAHEETGLLVEVDSILAVSDLMQGGGQRVPLYSVTFLAHVVGGELQHHLHESLDVRWFTRDEVPVDNLWEGGRPWLDVAFRVLAGETFNTYFDPPRPGFAP